MHDITARPRLLTPRTLAQFAIVTLIWGSTWMVIRTQLGVVPPAWSVAYRFLLGAAIMLTLCVVTGRSLRLGRAGHAFALAIAALQFVFNFNFVYHAEEHLTSGLVAVVFALLVVPNTLLSRLFLGTRITPRFAGGAGLGIVGVMMMFWTDLGMSGGAAYGLALVGLGVISASVANVLQAGKFARSLPLEGGLAVSMLYGGLLDAALAFATVGPPVFDTSATYLAGLAYLSVFASAVAFLLYYQLIRSIGPARAAYTGVVVPIVALSLSMVFEGYVWTPLAAAGAVLALAGLVVALRSRA